jgi:hypothetical protein
MQDIQDDGGTAAMVQGLQAMLNETASLRGQLQKESTARALAQQRAAALSEDVSSLQAAVAAGHNAVAQVLVRRASTLGQPFPYASSHGKFPFTSKHYTHR